MAPFIGIFMESILSDCLKRNAQREGDARIPDFGVEARAKDLTPPTEEEPFDFLFYAKMKDGVFGSDEIQVMIEKLNIENPVDIFFAKEVTY